MPDVATFERNAAKRFGAHTVVRGAQLPRDFPRLPSSVYAFDYATGGGFPVGGVSSCLYGPPGGGKSLLLLKTIACAQKLCWCCFQYQWDCTCEKDPLVQKVVLINTEPFDPEWAECLGVDLDNLVVVEPEYGEQAGDAISTALTATDCGLVCLDSIAMLIPIEELEKPFEESVVAVQARLVSRIMRVAQARLIKENKRGHKVTFIATNHIRSKIGQFFGNPEEVPGGWAAKHTWNLTMRMSQLKTEDDNIDKDTGLSINAKFRASNTALTNKRKIFMLHGSAEFYCTMATTEEFVKGTIPDFKTVEKAADEIEFIGRNPWSILDREYGTKTELIDDWKESAWYMSVKKKLVDQYREMAKMEL